MKSMILLLFVPRVSAKCCQRSTRGDAEKNDIEKSKQLSLEEILVRSTSDEAFKNVRRRFFQKARS